MSPPTAASAPAAAGVDAELKSLLRRVKLGRLLDTLPERLALALAESLAARLDNTGEAEMRKLARVELLILDDFALQAMDQVETADFYELVVERHRKTSTVITSNRATRRLSRSS